MSMYPRLNSRFLLQCLGSFAILLLAIPQSIAQLPSVLTYGARLQLPSSAGASIGTPSKVARDGAGDIFVLIPGTPAIYEIPINGPIQLVVPSTDTSIVGQANNVGFTVDPAGNLYTIKTNNTNLTGGITEIPRLANGTYNTAGEIGITTFVTPANGYFQANDIAVDKLGNIYLSSHAGDTQGSWLGVGIIMAGPSAPNGKYLAITTVAPTSVAVDSSGNVFYVDGTNAWEVTAASVASSSPASVQIGAASASACTGCTVMATPKYVFVDNAGDVYIGNGSSAIYLLPNSGSVFSTTSTTYTLPNTVVKSGYSYGAVGNNGDLYLTFGGSLEFYGAGKFYIGSPSVGTALAAGASSGTSYASPSAVFFFTQSVTLGSAGSPAYPYAIVNAASANGVAGPAQAILSGTNGSSTCVAAQTYTAGQSCTVELGYAAKGPGALTGSLVLYSSTGSILATVDVASLVTGPALVLDSVLPTTVGTGYAAPSGIAVDGSGAAYVADPAANTVLKFAAGSTAAGTSVATGLSVPLGVALDPSGNVFIADTGNNRVVVVPNYQSGLSAANQFVLSIPGYTLSSPSGIAIDSFGNVYVSDTGNGRVIELANPFATALGAKPTVVASGLTAPYGIAFDPYNDLIIADKGANTVYEVAGAMLTTTATTNFGSGALVAVGSGFNAPTGVASDASGSVYVTDSGNARIVKVPSESGVLTTADQSVLYSGLNKPYGIASNLTNDLYYTDQSAPGVYFALRSSPSGGKTGFLNFGSVAVNSTTSITSTISNAGLTTSLAVSAIASPGAPVTLGSASTNPCSATPTLLPGKGCNLLLTFNPTATGSTSAFFNVTDNALNGTAATQGIHYEGVVSGAVASVTLSGPTSVAYGDTATYTLTALDSSGNPAVAGNGTYTVNITGSATKTATVTLNGGTGTFFLPAVGVGSYNLATSVSGFAATAAVAVTKAQLLLTAASYSRVFDQANPAFGFTYSGFVNGDTAASLTGAAPVASSTATRVSNAGSYPITLTGSTLASANYTITLVNGTLTVGGAAPQAILFPRLPNYSSGTAVTLTGTATSGLPLTYTVTTGSATVSGNVLTITASGAVTVQATQAGNSNYAGATSVARSFTAQ